MGFKILLLFFVAFSFIPSESFKYWQVFIKCPVRAKNGLPLVS